MYQIRSYEPADRQACIEIFKSNMPLYFDSRELELLENWLNAKDMKKIAYPTNVAEHFYVLEHEGSVLACGGFYVPAGEKKASIVWGMVTSAWHKNGLGKKLLDYRIRMIKAMYPDYKIVLDTSQHTFQFFENQGFSVQKISLHSYGPDLHRYDMVM